MQNATVDESLEAGARRVLWQLGRDMAVQQPAASLHLSELSQGRWPDVDGLALDPLRHLHAAVYAAAHAAGRIEPAYFGATAAERCLACIVLADEVARLRVRVYELAPPDSTTTH